MCVIVINYEPKCIYKEGMLMRYARYSLPAAAVALSVLLSACWFGEKKKEEAGTTGKLLVVNVLGPKEYEDVHIKGSINVPLENLATAAQSWPKEVKVIVYCANYMCTASADAARTLTKQGFTDVLAYEGGVAEWKQKGFPVEGPAQQGYLASVGQKQQAPTDVKTIEAEALKEEIEKAEKNGTLITK